MSFGLSMTKFPGTGSWCQSGVCDPINMKLHWCDDAPWKTAPDSFHAGPLGTWSSPACSTSFWLLSGFFCCGCGLLFQSPDQQVHTWSTWGCLPCSFVQIILFTWLCLAPISPPALHSLVSLASISAWLCVAAWFIFLLFPLCWWSITNLNIDQTCI